MLEGTVWEEGIKLNSYRNTEESGMVALSYHPSTEEGKAGQTARDRRKENHGLSFIHFPGFTSANPLMILVSELLVLPF